MGKAGRSFACKHTYRHACIHAYIHACMRTKEAAYMHAYMHTCLHACNVTCGPGMPTISAMLTNAERHMHVNTPTHCYMYRFHSRPHTTEEGVGGRGDSL